MKPDPLHEKIEDYLSGQLEEEALLQFEKEMDRNPALAAEVDLYRDMDMALRPSKEDALRDSLALLDKKYAAAKPEKKTDRRWWIVALVVLAGFGIGLWWKSARIDPSKAPAMDHTRPDGKDVPTDTPQEKQPGDLILPETPGQKQTPPVAQDQQPEDKTKNEELLAANFEPNPQLEALVGNQVRGEEYRFRVLQPAANAPLRPKNGQTRLRASGLLETAVAEVKVPFRILLFSNKKEDYRTFKPVFSQSLTFEKSGDGFRFALDAQLKIPNGLYYFLIEDEDSGTLYYVSKLQVK